LLLILLFLFLFLEAALMPKAEALNRTEAGVKPMPTWIILALLSAMFAALVGILGKRGLEEVDPTLATAIRAFVMAVAMVAVAAGLGKIGGVGKVHENALGWIALSGAAGAASWLCYFAALRLGPAGGVAALDRLSVVFTLVLAALFLKEKLTPQVVLGGLLMVAGALLIVFKR
jgi:transporter family protein